MEYGKYYKIEKIELRNILNKLGEMGFQWREGISGSPMSKYLEHSVSLDLDDPVLEIEQYKHYKFVILTSEILLKNNKNSNEIHDYNDLMIDLQI
jgi:hypothetical protein